MFQYLSHVWQNAIKWFATWRPRSDVDTPDADAEKEPDPEPARELEPPKLQPATPSPSAAIVERKAKWVRPKGADLLIKQKRASNGAAPKTRAPKIPVLKQTAEDQERWGQYYFRDQILDQLDQYFIYLKRLRIHANDAYELHKKLGIHIIPSDTLAAFDAERFEGTLDDLDAWWKEHRPGFGAVSYSIDRIGLLEDKITTVDAPPEWKGWKSEAAIRAEKEPLPRRILHLTRGDRLQDGETSYKTGVLWTPKFLIFSKYDRKKVPAFVQRVTDGDIYNLIVYWDRRVGRTRKWLKTEGKKGGSPQAYTVCVEKQSGKVRVLKTLLHESHEMRSKHGANRGKTFSIPSTYWGISADTTHLQWAVGNLNTSPEDYLRRVFIEAAMLYQQASMGSMIRIEASKGDMVAAFGIEVRRMAYFFRDRDVTVSSVTEGGRRRPVFHIVRPHVRHTKKGATPVKMHFSGLKDFTWAGYKIRITVPGRDHVHLPEIDIGGADSRSFKKTERTLNARQFALKVRSWIDQGVGKWN
jgi:hypothetical protein